MYICISLFASVFIVANQSLSVKVGPHTISGDIAFKN